jgi:hypothetical protein
MAEARPNIAIAPIRIDARIIVFALPRCLPFPSRRFTVTAGRTNYRPVPMRESPSTITFSRLLGDEGSALEPLD